MINELKQALVRENIQSDYDIATLAPDFYEKVVQYTVTLGELERLAVDDIFDKLLRKRLGKIIIKAQGTITDDIKARLTREELELVESINRNITNFMRRSKT